MAWEIMKAIDRKFETSILQAFYLLYGFHQASRFVFSRNGRILVANPSPDQFQDVSVLSSATLLLPLIARKSIQCQALRFFHDVYGRYRHTYYSSQKPLVAVNMTAALAAVALGTPSEYGSVALASSWVVPSVRESLFASPSVLEFNDWEHSEATLAPTQPTAGFHNLDDPESKPNVVATPFSPPSPTIREAVISIQVAPSL